MNKIKELLYWLGWLKKPEPKYGNLTQGSFNTLFRPGLRKDFQEAYEEKGTWDELLKEKGDEPSNNG